MISKPKSDMLTTRSFLLVFIGLILITLSINFTFEGSFYIGSFHVCKGIDSEQKIAPVAKKPLPEIAVARRVWHNYTNVEWQGLQLPVLTSEPRGRLGNIMGEYATLFALGRIYGATVRLHPSMRSHLIQPFPNISMELLPEGPFDRNEWIIIGFVTFINYGKYEAAASGLLGPERFLLTGYPFEIQLFNAFREDIVNEFTFSPDIQNQVQAFWGQNERTNSEVIVGFHVRRTDYVEFIKKFHSKLPEDAYFQRAMAYYKKKFPEVRFLVASDDMDYVKKAFVNRTDVLYAPGSPRELDMALLASCDHSIVTVGSFGFWCGYLAGGEVVYPNITIHHDYTFQKSWYDFGQLDFFTPLPMH